MQTVIRIWRGVLLVVLLGAFAGGVCVWAQQDTAEIVGRITDPTGAAIPGARIIVLNPSRGIKSTATSNGNGQYVVPLLPPGSGYQLQVSRSGFSTVTRTNIILQVTQVARIDMSLSVGSVQQKVVVTGAPPLLDTQTSSEGAVITGNTIQNLPLNGRSAFRLINLTPSVTFSIAAAGQYGDIPTNSTFDSNFSINGGRAQANEILIDGVPSGAGFYDQITYVPPVEATEEFKVISDNLPAEYGRFAGGVVDVTTRPGTDRFHGSLFEFLRNTNLDANDYFSNQAHRAKAPFHMNQFGVAVGGPIIIPHLYNKRGKLFFFFEYQNTLRHQGQVFTATVPTAAERTGDFSQSPKTIYNPFSTQPDPARPGHYIRTAFQGNIIPSGLIDPVAAKIISYYPMPNTGGPNARANNYISSNPLVDIQPIYTVRIDDNVNSHYRVYGRYGASLTQQTPASNYNDIASPGNGAVGTTYLNNFAAAIDNTFTFSPTFLLTVNYGFARWFQFRKTLSYGFDNSTLGFPDQFVKSITIPMFPTVNVAGYNGMNGQSYLHNGNDSHSLITSFTKIAGRHTLGFGVDLRMHRINFYNVQASAGTFNFGAAQTQGPDPNASTSTAGDGVASLLLGAGSGGSMPIGSGVSMKDWYIAGYIQDDFRVNNRLTLNMGLRYETESPYTDNHNRLNYFDPNVLSPAANSEFPSLTGGLVFAAVDGHSSEVYRWNKNQFGPRFGFSYNPIRNTVIRGGFGLVYAPLVITNSAVGSAADEGYSSSTGWDTSNDGGLTPFNLLSNPYPQGLVQPTGNSLGAGTLLGQGISVWQHNEKTPQSEQWNFGIEEQLPSSMLAEVAYVGSRGLHLGAPFEDNALDPKYLSLGSALQAKVANPFQQFVSVGPLSQPTVTRQQLLLPFPQFTGVTEINNTWGSSEYNALQAKLEKRVTHGVSFLAAFTMGKLMSNVLAQQPPIGPTNTNSPRVQNWYDLRNEWSLSEMNLARSFVFSGVAQLPFGPGMRFGSDTKGIEAALIGGWTVNGILTEQTGPPLVIYCATAGGGTRPNVVPGVSPNLPSSRPLSEKLSEWFNTNAFSLPAAFTYGNASRVLGQSRGPALKNLDFSVEKVVSHNERYNLAFHAEAFNLTNTPHFWLPDMAIRDPGYGTISKTVLSPREIQLALKLSF